MWGEQCVEYRSKVAMINMQMLVLGMNETIVHLVMESSLSWYEHVLRREDVRIPGRGSVFEAEDQRKRVRKI